jgi:soluble lytic murein transglycosylase
MPKLTNLLAASLTLLLALTSYAEQKNDSAMDERFLLLREAAAKDDAPRASELASQLSAYPVKSYVDYYQLKARLPAANESEITDFLTRYAGSAIADRLRNDWLLVLGRQGNWATFDVHYPQFVVDDDVQVKCYDLLSELSKGLDVAYDARKLLTSAKVYGEACYPLFAKLVQSGQFSSDDMWNQIRWAAEAPTAAVAIKLAALANLNNTANALEKSVTTSTFDKPLAKTDEAHQTALILLGRLAKTNPENAVAALNKISRYLTDDELAIAWAQIALPASQRLQSNANDYWKKTEDAPLSLDGYQWRVRAALRNTDWPQVKAGIESMPPSLLSEPTWVYWLGRAYEADNQNDIAQSLFQNIVDQPSFYGQLAREESGLPITIPETTPAQQRDVAAASKNAGLQNALRFYAMNLRFEGNREWNWQLRQMSEQQLLAAAEFARQNNVLDRMVNSSDRTKTIFDFSQRFPTPYKDAMTQNTSGLGLDMAWVYGLIRQESRFIVNARSNVGASGLMQVMPDTARYVMRKVRMDNVDPANMNSIDSNIALGTNYLNIVLKDLNGSQVLASAGYNAGPGRARNWRSSLPKPVEGAIFAETIPFQETRDYVKNVLSNATYYAVLFRKTPQSLKARLGIISPEAYTMDALVLKH